MLANVAASTMQIRVYYNYMCFRLNVDPQATARQLKLTLYNTDGINLPTYGQHLRYHYNTVGAAHSSVSFPLEEELTLADTGSRTDHGLIW